MPPREITVAYEAKTAAGVRRERGPVGVIGLSGSHAVTGTVSLLRQRLRFFNLLQAVIWALVVLGSDTPFIVSARGHVEPIGWVLAAEHALIVVVAGSLLYVL